MALSSIQMVDEKTGACEGYLTTQEYNTVQLNRSAKLDRLNDKNAIKNKEKFAVFIRENCGSFNFTLYNKIVSAENLLRFIFICTHMNYKNFIEVGNASGVSRLANKKDLQEILNLKNQQFYNTINYLIKEEFIIKVDDNFMINKDFSMRGKVPKKKLKEGSVRMFDDAIKEIYEKAQAKEHKKLDLLVKILPFVHYELNVIAHNPNEEIPGQIKAITLTELAEIFEYSTVQRLKRNLFNITVDGQPVIMLVVIENQTKIVINPKIYYKGNNLEQMQGIMKLFEVK